jgi:hypothetical protein
MARPVRLRLIADLLLDPAEWGDDPEMIRSTIQATKHTLAELVEIFETPETGAVLIVFKEGAEAIPELSVAWSIDPT